MSLADSRTNGRALGGLTDIDRCPVQNLGTARLPNLHRMRHTDFRKNMNFLIF
jgi:hypothetical protein